MARLTRRRENLYLVASNAARAHKVSDVAPSQASAQTDAQFGRRREMIKAYVLVVTNPGQCLHDRRAKHLRQSRNHFIVATLKKEIEHETTWSPGFLDAFRALPPDLDQAFAESMTAVSKARVRRRKSPL